MLPLFPTLEHIAHIVVYIGIAFTLFPLQPKRGSERATVFKPTGIVYQLKMKQSRQTYGEVQQRFGTMAFSLRSFEVRVPVESYRAAASATCVLFHHETCVKPHLLIDFVRPQPPWLLW
jgi:hypothetical protein